MSGETIAIIVLGIVIIFLFITIGALLYVSHETSIRTADKEKDLLNRIMTRNYETFVQAEVVKNQSERVLTPEEIYEQQLERGIPV